MFHRRFPSTTEPSIGVLRARAQASDGCIAWCQSLQYRAVEISFRDFVCGDDNTRASDASDYRESRSAPFTAGMIETWDKRAPPKRADRESARVARAALAAAA